MTREAPGNTESLGVDPSDPRCFCAGLPVESPDAGLWGLPVPNRETCRHTVRYGYIPGGFTLTKLTDAMLYRNTEFQDEERDIRRAGEQRVPLFPPFVFLS